MEKFSKTFWSPYEKITTVDGQEVDSEKLIDKEFIVITEKDKGSYDFEEIGVMYIIELDGGILLGAYPEEVENEWQIKNGRNEYPNGLYKDGKCIMV
jgi:hypothetical protein